MINQQLTLLIFEENMFLLEKFKVDQLIQSLLTKHHYYLTYIVFISGYYIEENDEIKYLNAFKDIFILSFFARFLFNFLIEVYHYSICISTIIKEKDSELHKSSSKKKLA
jgi:hypothetical protein